MSFWNSLFHGITEGHLRQQDQKLDAIERNIAKIADHQTQPALHNTQHTPHAPYNICGIPTTEAEKNEMFFRANMESAEKATREGRHEDADHCRQLAHAYRCGGGNRVSAVIWRHGERDAVKKRDFARAAYCAQKAMEAGG